MELYEKIKYLLDKPEIRLLASNNSDFILSFLYNEFKLKEKEKITKSELLFNLRYFISTLPKTDIGYQHEKVYLNNWQTEEKPYLKDMYFDDNERDFIVQPTIHVKRVFRWLDDLQEEKIIVSQIGFLAIIETIKNLIFGTLENPDEKLAQLIQEKQKIENQISKLEKIKLSDEKVELLDIYIIQDTYKKIVQDAEKLIFDFDVVAEQYNKLKEIVKDKFNIEKLSTGKILGDLISAEKQLQDEIVVKSYNEFRKYLHPEKQDELKQLLEKLHEVPDIKNIEDNFLVNLIFNLWNASKKVGDIDEEIFSWLKNIFNEGYQEKAKKTYQLIQEIKKIIIENKALFPDKNPNIEIEIKPNLFTDKFCATPQKIVKFEKRKIKSNTDSIPENIANDMVNGFFFDIEILRQNISALLENRDEITLNEIIEIYPIKQGLPEIIAYTMIASEDKNIINRNIKQNVIYEDNMEVTLPLMIYKK